MKTKGQIVFIAAILLIISYVISLFQVNLLYRDLLLIAVTIISGYSIFKNAFNALLYRIIGIELLVSVAVTGAIIIGEYTEAAIVTFLFILGAFLESLTLEKTRKSLQALMDLAPSQAIVIRNQIEQEIPVEEVLVNDIVVVKPGAKIPVDGIVIKGSATVNQSSITGESLPIDKNTGMEVYSGTVNETGYLEVQAVKVGPDTTFSKIIELVEEARDKKAKTQKFVESFAKYYTPFILFLAFLIFLITKDIRLSLTLLVISCPGALVISIPVSIVAGIGNGARNGILIKGGEFLEKAAKVKIVAFDKTGTLTKGKPKVSKIYSFHTTQEEVLEIAGSIELYSEHHLAKAILLEAKVRSIQLHKADAFQVFPGLGVKGALNNQIYYVGNRKLLTLNNILISKEIEKQLQTEETNGETTVLVATDKEVMGFITISDEIKTEAYDIVMKLKKHGIKKVIMLTGDHQTIGTSVGKKLHIDEVYAELLPHEKLAIIKKLQEKEMIAMIGDGINDAPALALADLGISMGDIGTDVAIETADIVLLSDDLNKLNTLFSLSKATNRNMKQNLYFALSVVLLLIVGVILGKVFMSLGMLIHEISVILVIVNAIRLNRIKDKTR